MNDAQPPGSGAKILIVEDEVVLQDVYKFVLSSKGYEVYTANNGALGLEQLAETSPDLVILDVFMPVMNGIDFLKSFDAAKHPHTKIVVYSNLSDSHTEAQVLALGAQRFVLKSSMTPTDLVNLVHDMLAS